MYYTIYKTYNLINGKEYTGKHQTHNINDEYIGSGKYLKRAIIIYGKDNFVKDILYVFNTEQEMNIKEKELVTEEYINSGLSYNLCPGGHGGFGYINKNGLTDTKKGNIEANKVIKEKYGAEHVSQILSVRNKLSKAAKENHKKGVYINFRCPKGIIRSEETKIKTKQTFSKIGHQQGIKSSQYGTCWITDGITNKKIKKEELALYINQGYYKGRIM